MFEKEYFGSFEDTSNYYKIVVKVLKKDKTWPTKLSLEVSHIKNVKDIRSFRTDSKVTFENLMVSLASGLSFFLMDFGLQFKDADGKMMDPKNMEQAVNDYWAYLGKKMKFGFFDGIKKYAEGIKSDTVQKV